MKKITLILICLMLLCGCAGDPITEPNTTTSSAVTTNPETENSEALSTDPTEDPFVLAQGCIGHSTDYLISLIGEPESIDYAPSCLVEGAEDGNWYYDGFTVYTIRTADGELVEYVE